MLKFITDSSTQIEVYSNLFMVIADIPKIKKCHKNVTL